MVARFARVVAAATAAGLGVGGIVGGALARLMMRVLVLTSDASVHGAITDDDAVVNKFTLDGTIGFIMFCALGGAVLALGYVVLRRWLPASRVARGAIYGLLFLGVQGSTVFDPHGFDFTRLAPTWLAVAIFTGIFFAVGYLTVVAVDRALDRWPPFSRKTWYAYAPLIGLAPIAPIVVPIALAGGVAYLIHTNESVRRAWESQPLTFVGQVVLAVATLNWLLPTLADISDILVG